MVMAYQAHNMRQIEAIANGAALTSGVVTAVGMQFSAGQQIHTVNFASATAAAGTPTHWQFGVYSPAATPARLGQSTDQTTTAWAANTLKGLSMGATTPVVIPKAGWYWVAILVTATTVPTLLSATAIPAGLLSASGIIAPQAALAITSGSALTALPATLAAPATALVVPWCAVS